MEEFLKLQRMELLRQGAPDSDNEDWDNPQWPEEREDCPDKEEDDSLENADLAFTRRSESENKSRKIVRTKITGLKTKKTKRTRVKESWKVKADKVKAIRKDLKRSETETEKEIKRRQAKIEKFLALKDSILKFSFLLHLQLHLSFLFYLPIPFHHLHFPFFMFISIAISCTLFKNLHFEISRIARSIFLYKLKPYIWQRKQKLSPQSWDQQDCPEILKPDQLYPLEFTQEHIGSSNITTIRSDQDY
jgi:hypothetical protein